MSDVQLKIGSIPLSPGAALAPMAGITDVSMRRLCAAQGAMFTVSEMVSTRALTQGDRKSRALLRGATRGPGAQGLPPAPYGVQLFGDAPDVLAEAIARIEDEDYDFIDLNMGCPAPKICGHGAGSGLLRTPALAGEFAAAAVRASSRPVTAKLRIGWDDDSLTGLEVARRCEDAGIALLVVHARTRAQQYAPGVNQAAVAEIKRAVGIPVLYNGDVDSAEAALAAIQATGCDGVAIGRAALGDPFLFARVAAALAGLPPPPPPTLRQRLAAMEQQLRGMCDEKGEERAMREGRKVAAGYMRGLRGAAMLRRQAVSLTWFDDVPRLCQMAYELNEGPEGQKMENA